jgi:hypothetical protein
MGVGKSSVGKLVADALGMEFVDIDDTIVAGVGMIIPSIFKERGEKGFRELEKDATEKASEMEGVVIACGGGTPRRGKPPSPQKELEDDSPDCGSRDDITEGSGRRGHEAPPH